MTLANNKLPMKRGLKNQSLISGGPVSIKALIGKSFDFVQIYY